MPKAPQNLRQIESLVELVAALRSPEGCPWDREQTHSSLTQYAIEETFEFVDAVESQSDAKMKDELGDMLFQVALHSQLAAERGAFDLADVIANLNEKMIRRHPHVFSDLKLDNSEAVIENWEKIKRKEKSEVAADNPLNVPSGMPALQRAYKIGKRTEKLQFDWDNAGQVWEKVEEEHQELQEAIEEKSLAEIEHELGDVLFSVAQLARHLKLDPEQSLRKANQRFERRFAKMKEFILADSKNFEDMKLEEKESYWQKAKAALKAHE